MAKFQSIPEGYMAIEESYKEAPKAKPVGMLNPNDTAEVTIRIRRKKVVKAGGKRMNYQEFAQQHGAAEEDMREVEDFAHANHLSIVSSHSARRCLIVKGRIKDLEQAFRVNLAQYYDSGQTVWFRGRTGCVHVPAQLHDIITGVFGLDDRPAARPMLQIAKKEGKFIPLTAAPKSYTPDELARIYSFPEDASGEEQCIGIIELGGGYRIEDLNNYFDGLGLETPVVKAVSVDGGYNAPSTADSADGEVMLDIEVAGGVAPDAKIVVYFAPNSDKGFLDAITTAIHDEQNNPSVISISWGAAEDRWTQQALNNFNDAFQSAALLGVTICAAAGDQGSADRESDGKVHADFPASSPYVLACGGTKLVASGDEIESEVVWHESNNSATGGGVSEHFALPDYQKNTDIPLNLNDDFKGRGLPDVAGNADPQTGYEVLVDGQELIIGGTSAVAPLMAGLIARVNELQSESAGFIHPALYTDPSGVRDIIKGNNITTSTNLGYEAGPGWDACTGWGVLYRLASDDEQ